MRRMQRGTQPNSCVPFVIPMQYSIFALFSLILVQPSTPQTPAAPPLTERTPRYPGIRIVQPPPARIPDMVCYLFVSSVGPILRLLTVPFADAFPSEQPASPDQEYPWESCQEQR